MKEFLAKAVKSKLFKGIVALIAAALTAWATAGCAALLGAAEHPAVGVLACKAEVLEPLLGDAAEDVVRAIDGDRAFDPVSFFLRQGLSPKDIAELVKAYTACEPDAPADPAQTQS